MRLVFMGTPDFSVPCLTRLVESGHDVVACYTRPPAASGRGLSPRPSPVQRRAEALGIEVLTPRNLRSPEAAAAFTALAPGVAVVVAYGLILPPAILAAPRHACLNLHASLLPRWRGAAPIQRAILAGDRETGVSIMRMEEGLDTGPVALTETVPIGPDDTAGDLHDRLAGIGAELMLRALAGLEAGTLTFTPQPEAGVTYARKIAKDEGRLDWRGAPAALHNQVRGLSPAPGAFFEADLGRGRERVKVLRARLADGAGLPGTLLDNDGTVACGEGALRLIEVQRAGRGAMAAAAFLRGARLKPGDRFDATAGA